MSMRPAVEATRALSSLPMGSRIVATDVGDDGTAYGRLLEQVPTVSADPGGAPGAGWKDLTERSAPFLTARQVIDQYDDMVIVHLNTHPEGQQS